MTSDFDSLIDDFLGSDRYLLLGADIKEHAAGILASFAGSSAVRGVTTPDQLTISALEDTLMNHLAQLDLALGVRRLIPELLREFFSYLAESGRFPPARSWNDWISALDEKYQSRFRENGSVKGETFRKKYSDVNRNDPCPCGSGKKFKKCCMGLIS
jgi:hypothetical protein